MNKKFTKRLLFTLAATLFAALFAVSCASPDDAGMQDGDGVYATGVGYESYLASTDSFDSQKEAFETKIAEGDRVLLADYQSKNCVFTETRLGNVAHTGGAQTANAIGDWIYSSFKAFADYDSASTATKNVIGIAAGALDGLGLSSLKGSLMARAPREISRLIAAMGGDPVSVYGLCHLGDYEATVFSKYSHNRMFGEMYIKGERFDRLAEGYYTAEAIMQLGEKYGVDLPICSVVYNVLYKGADVKEEMGALFSRSLKYEFE